MSWLQLIVLCTWLSVAMIFAANMMDKLTSRALDILSGKVEEFEGRIEDLTHKVEVLEFESPNDD